MGNIEKIHKTIVQIVTTGTTAITGCTGSCEYHTSYGGVYVKFGDTNIKLIPDLAAVYNIKILLTSNNIDIGYFNAVNIDNVT